MLYTFKYKRAVIDGELREARNVLDEGVEALHHSLHVFWREVCENDRARIIKVKAGEAI